MHVSNNVGIVIPKLQNATRTLSAGHQLTHEHCVKSETLCKWIHP